MGNLEKDGIRPANPKESAFKHAKDSVRTDLGALRQDVEIGSEKNPIIDSGLDAAAFNWSLGSRLDALQKNGTIKKENLAQAKEIFAKQRLVDVSYYSFDGKVHKGQIVVHADFAADVKKVFQVILKDKFPIQKAVPISAYGWDDNRSMEANNTSSFNYRPNTSDPTKLSEHSKGIAIDINPRINPFMRQKAASDPITIQPKGATYRPGERGVLTEKSPVVAEFKRLGWEWGGEWAVDGVKLIKDYQHFEKPLKSKPSKR